MRLKKLLSKLPISPPIIKERAVTIKANVIYDIAPT